jgi:transglutaminase-like putative cysteine protease
MSVYKIIHITQYTYERPVTESVNEIRIYPYFCEDQEILQHDLLVSFSPDIQLYRDYWGNRTGLFSILEPHDRLVIESRLIIRTTRRDALIWTDKASFTQLRADMQQNLQLLELAKPERIRQQEEIHRICSLFYDETLLVPEVVQSFSEYIFQSFTYSKGITTIETTVDEILEHRSGVCQDFAHLLLQLLRSKEIPCRYVSGYICPHKNGMRGEGATHAWVEVWIPGEGWRGIDPTNNVWVTNAHVKLAVGRHFSDCSVVKGTFRGMAKQDLHVYVSVGYEDGMTFEETNQVIMHKEPGQNPSDELPRLTDWQQQQQ